MVVFDSGRVLVTGLPKSPSLELDQTSRVECVWSPHWKNQAVKQCTKLCSRNKENRQLTRCQLCIRLWLWYIGCGRINFSVYHNLPFGLWTRVDIRQHKFNRIRQVAPMCPSVPSWEGTLAPPGEYDWTVRPSAAAMRPYVKLLWPLVWKLHVVQIWRCYRVNGHLSNCCGLSVTTFNFNFSVVISNPFCTLLHTGLPTVFIHVLSASILNEPCRRC